MNIIISAVCLAKQRKQRTSKKMFRLSHLFWRNAVRQTDNSWIKSICYWLVLKIKVFFLFVLYKDAFIYNSENITFDTNSNLKIILQINEHSRHRSLK